MKNFIFCAAILAAGCSIGRNKGCEDPIEPKRITVFAAATPLSSYQNGSEYQSGLRSCPYVAGKDENFDIKYIIQAKCYINWSEDVRDFHYHGREREATLEEIELFTLDLEIGKQFIPPDKADQLREEKAVLEEKYGDKIEALRIDDEIRFKKRIGSYLN